MSHAFGRRLWGIQHELGSIGGVNPVVVRRRSLRLPPNTLDLRFCVEALEEALGSILDAERAVAQPSW